MGTSIGSGGPGAHFVMHGAGGGNPRITVGKRMRNGESTADRAGAVRLNAVDNVRHSVKGLLVRVCS